MRQPPGPARRHQAGPAPDNTMRRMASKLERLRVCSTARSKPVHDEHHPAAPIHNRPSAQESRGMLQSRVLRQWRGLPVGGDEDV